jgi:outer membrane protein OmpA-like peptidoglycan-associated protein
MTLFVSTLLFSSELEDEFFKGSFEEIIRFDMLHFDSNGTLDEKSENNFKKIIDKVDALKKESYQMKITAIGHMYKADEYYPPVMNLEMNDNKDDNSSKDRSQEYVDLIYKKLLDNGVQKDIIYKYSKRGKFLAFSDETKQSADLSNRVMLTLYVLQKSDVDSDNDGVLDKDDRCTGTRKGIAVDKNGCPLDSDKDGIVDYKDRCPNTPFEGIKVDKYGCAIDSDHDGVADYKDTCKDTPLHIKVDPRGCPLKQTLKLNFKTNSDKILKSSYPAVKQFAEYLKQNPQDKVKIIGHTDSIGSAEHNMLLSIRRAKAVKKALIAEGIDSSRIVVKGRGELDPLESNRTKEGRSVNRRIEIELFN